MYNTLYDWVAFYIPSFRALVSEISRVSRVPEDQLWPSFRRLHQKHGTTEYPFAIQEIDALDDVDRGLSPLQRQDKYKDAIRAFRHLRRTLLRPYPDVPEGLARLHERGVLLAAHSDSMTVPVSRRLRQLELDTYFDAIFGSQDVGIPHYLGVSDVRKASDADVGARVPVLELPPGVRKPEPASLLPVLAHFGMASDAAVYLGDSLRRDVALASPATFALSGPATALVSTLGSELTSAEYPIGQTNRSRATQHRRPQVHGGRSIPSRTRLTSCCSSPSPRHQYDGLISPPSAATSAPPGFAPRWPSRGAGQLSPPDEQRMRAGRHSPNRWNAAGHWLQLCLWARPQAQGSL